jgi:hypothetical protein
MWLYGDYVIYVPVPKLGLSRSAVVRTVDVSKRVLFVTCDNWEPIAFRLVVVPICLQDISDLGRAFIDRNICEQV